MVFTRKDGDFPASYVSLPEGMFLSNLWKLSFHIHNLCNLWANSGKSIDPSGKKMDTKQVATQFFFANLYYPFSHNHGSVENHPKWKETNIGGTHFHFHDYGRKGNQKKTSISGEKYRHHCSHSCHDSIRCVFTSFPGVLGSPNLCWKKPSWFSGEKRSKSSTKQRSPSTPSCILYKPF